MYIVFINCDLFPFIAWIIAGIKLYETRNKNTLKSLIGKTVYLAKTGKGKKPVVYCKATIKAAHTITDPVTYEKYREYTCIKKGSVFDWKTDTKRKVLYKLTNVEKIKPFVPKEGKRTGYSFMEYNGIERSV